MPLFGNSKSDRERSNERRDGQRRTRGERQREAEIDRNCGPDRDHWETAAQLRESELDRAYRNRDR